MIPLLDKIRQTDRQTDRAILTVIEVFIWIEGNLDA